MPVTNEMTERSSRPAAAGGTAYHYMEKKKIVLTGGGTAGHVTPNIALLGELRKRGYEIHYIGSYEGIEKDLIRAEGVPYYGISSGKLRRYFDWQNFTDPARVIKGLTQARAILHRLKPNIVFSKGGFVSVPVVIAAKTLGIPVIIHESDMTPGLANRLSFSSASAVCCNFPETVKHLPEGKAVLTGSPIRPELLAGRREAGLAFCGFTADKPVLLIIGGSLGSVAVNTARFCPSFWSSSRSSICAARAIWTRPWRERKATGSTNTSARSCRIFSQHAIW